MANEQMAAYWSDHAGPEWVTNEEVFDHMLEPFGRVAIEALGLAAGESVLDVGCGFGTTSLDAARIVGPGGRVVGVDIAPAMIDRATQRAADLSIDTVTFVVADAQTYRLDRPIDTVVSRFGVMFFDDPVSAFTNLHAVVRPGGRLSFVCWQSQDLNPWVTAPSRAWEPYLPEPFASPPPGSPGPFAFAEEGRLARLLSLAGWTDVMVEPLVTEARMGAGDGVDGALRQAFATTTGRALRDAIPADRHEEAVDALRELFTAQLRDGAVVFPAAAWVATARR